MIAESSGKGIELYAGMNQLPAPTQLEKRVVQEYVEDPFLVNVLQGKRKTDLRIYAVITSFDPVRIYLHTAGQVKVAQSVYSNNFTNHFAHISNAVGSAEDPYDLKNKTLRVERQIDEFKWRLTLDDLRGLVMVPHLMEVNNDPGWNPYYEKRKYTVATKGGNANGAKCLFPFVYQGTKHLECIPKPAYNTPVLPNPIRTTAPTHAQSKTDPTLWCYTDEYESWGECDQTSENAHNKDSLQQVFNAVYGDLVFLTGVIPYDPEFELVVIERYETLCAAALMPAACRIEQVKNKVVVMANEMQARGDFRYI
ncbi:hypothetical protein SARC_05896 [Sphaeroforma arctica JP610]|uniref:Tubulin--tyrosine ligase-like protein 5 n=1 Tax=Sphaeroforma arctica JP610 TaxID=667725 RepID=A0A0L0FY84_9EUKA|nr:hypothetical protein SARC_05896 [Sphaeroforma arctica JP610]KNC81800.1 hypothetical protein SARC_05896 [Sphaeroforma arctica JP610]|eukprot:XP_014155702.1 hypothetical protein SARC_05896 [Sphaeroforma arctica JP610]